MAYPSLLRWFKHLSAPLYDSQATDPIEIRVKRGTL